MYLAFSDMDLTVDDTFKSVVHAAALNENRYQFAKRSIYENSIEAGNKNDKELNGNFRLEKGFLGAHSDIGGGYAEGDLSNASLMWIVKHAKEAGIKVDESIVNREKYNQVNDPVVHDSVGVEKSGVNFMPGREFRWVGSDVEMFDGRQQSERFDHLKFNWNDSQQFQPKDAKGNILNRFQQIRDLTLEYNRVDQTLTGHPTCGDVIMCNETKAITNLKEKDAEGNPTIVYSKNVGGHINVKGYIAWLKRNGYGLTDLKVNVK